MGPFVSSGDARRRHDLRGLVGSYHADLRNSKGALALDPDAEFG
jgi:hypothetical protein